MCRRHARDGIGHNPLAGNAKLDYPAFGLSVHGRLGRDQLHIHEVIAQRLNIDLGVTHPVRRIG